MIHLIRFSVVVAFSISIGLLCAFGIVRFTNLDELQRPFSQIFILLIFILLAHKAGWLAMARETWGQTEEKKGPIRLVGRVVGLCMLGVALGLVMRLGIQGAILVPLRILHPALYSAESRDLVDLWQNSQELSLTRLALFAMGATREEIMYRFVILGAMIKIFNPLKAILFSSLIFAAVHLNPIVLLSGIIFAYVFLISKSLILTSVMHTAANAWHAVVAKYGLVSESVNPADIIFSSYGALLVSSAIALFLIIFIFSVAFFKRSDFRAKMGSANSATD